MSNPDIRYATMMLLSAAGAALALAGTPISAGGTTDAGGETYEWSGSLMSFDEGTNTAIIRARIMSDIEGLDSFSEGERLTLTWSGLHFASGVRSSEKDGRYVHFRIAVPESATEAMAESDPGMWVTGTSPMMADDWSTAVHSLRHYNDVD